MAFLDMLGAVIGLGAMLAYLRGRFGLAGLCNLDQLPPGEGHARLLWVLGGRRPKH